MSTRALPNSITVALQPHLAHAVTVLTEEIAAMMEKLHGGRWRIQIEHDVGLIVVAKRGK